MQLSALYCESQGNELLSLDLQVWMSTSFGSGALQPMTSPNSFFTGNSPCFSQLIGGTGTFSLVIWKSLKIISLSLITNVCASSMLINVNCPL